jgi:hypothetical protein
LSTVAVIGHVNVMVVTELDLRFGSALWPNLKLNLRFRFSQVQFRFTVVQTMN